MPTERASAHRLRTFLWAMVGVAVACLSVYAVRQPLLTALGRFLIVQDPIEPADAIVVLSGSVPDRILEAVDLYHAHLAPRIILTRERPLPGLAALRAKGGTLAERHEQNLSIAKQLGVPPQAISVLPARRSSTFDETEALISYLQAQGIRSILLVTSKAHARRARLISRDVAGSSVRIALCPSRYDPLSADGWWHDRARARRVIIEYGKLLVYLAIDRWRVHPVGPAPQ